MSTENFLESLKAQLDDLRTLRIVTRVGGVRFENGKPRIDYEEGARVMMTKIDVLGGDMEVSVDPMYLDDAYASLRELHAINTRESRAIINANIEAVKSLLALARDIG